MESQRNAAYIKNRKKAIDINITQMIGGQAMGEEMRHVQISS